MPDNIQKELASLRNRAQWAIVLQQPDKALDIAKDAFDLALEIYGEEHEAFANALVLLADVYRGKGDDARAEAICCRALQILLQIGCGEGTRPYANCIGALMMSKAGLGSDRHTVPSAHEIQAKAKTAVFP